MNKVFDAYAAYYDLVYAGKNYRTEADYVGNLISQYAPQAKSILELGCGTGGHAEYLARKGYNILGIDSSSEMLKRANDRIARLPTEVANRVSFYPGDVRSYRSGRVFDVVVSLFHVMSYQVQDVDLEAAFCTAAEQLKPGGVFIFDYWFGPAVLAQRPETRELQLECEDFRASRTATPTMHFENEFVQVDYVIQVQRKNEANITQLQERHDMRYLFLPDIERMVKPYFKVKAHYGWLKQIAPTESDWAGITVLERNSHC